MSAEAQTNDPLSSAAWAEFRSELRAFAATQLPAATVPARFVVLPELPKLPNGKVNRAALASLSADSGTPAASYQAPQTPEEIRTAAVWADVLGVRRVGLHDDFFDLGGNSLLASRMAARMHAETGLVVNLRRLFDNPTVARLVAQLHSDGGAAEPRGLRRVHDTRSLSAADLTAEARLPGDIAPEPGAAPPTSAPYREVLLTGGTGYTGAYLLRELIDRSEARVTVLVRARDTSHAAQRVRETMTRYEVWRDGDERRIEALVGDLARPWFGLGRADYRRLAEQTEMILHNGALSSYSLPYKKLKPVNVLGTQEVLRLACRHRIKPVHYISSLAVFPGRPGRPVWKETESTDADGVVGGYRQTKWVGDSMMAQAGRRGLPINVYRPGLLTGAQSTGACSTDTFMNAMIKGFIQLGMAFPFETTVEITPADFFAAAVVHIALQRESHGVVFNVPGARSMAADALIDRLNGHGHRVRMAGYREWFQALSEAVERGEGNELARFLPLFGEDEPAADLGYVGSAPVYQALNFSAALEKTGLVCAPPDQELFDRYLNWFAATGYLPAPPAQGGEQA